MGNGNSLAFSRAKKGRSMLTISSARKRAKFLLRHIPRVIITVSVIFVSKRSAPIFGNCYLYSTSVAVRHR